MPLRANFVVKIVARLVAVEEGVASVLPPVPLPANASAEPQAKAVAALDAKLDEIIDIIADMLTDTSKLIAQHLKNIRDEVAAVDQRRLDGIDVRPDGTASLHFRAASR